MEMKLINEEYKIWKKNTPFLYVHYKYQKPSHTIIIRPPTTTTPPVPSTTLPNALSRALFLSLARSSSLSLARLYLLLDLAMPK